MTCPLGYTLKLIKDMEATMDAEYVSKMNNIM